MNEKKYLTLVNKIGYGSGDIAGNVVYALLASFVMIFLTDTVGLAPGIVGTLIAVSKLFDGISDVFFGAMIDKTHSKMGKARPWMFYGYFGCAVCLIAIFCIPADLSDFAKYAWFFIAYTVLNAGFYTANNIAYSALTALITKNNHERVQMGSIRFMFAFGTSMLIQAVTVGFVAKLGGGAAAWRTVAIVYAIIGVISNSLSVFSVKELSEEELAEGEDQNDGQPEEKYNLIDAFKILVHNKYFIMICGAYLLMQLYSATLGMGIYFMKYVLKDELIYGKFAWAINIPMIIGLLVTPSLVAHFKGMYKLNIGGYFIGTLGRAGVLVAAYMGNIPLMFVFTSVAAFGMSPLQGDMNMLSKDKENYVWFYLLTQELALFKPYFTLGCEHDDEFKKLKQQYDYVSDQFIRRQTIVSQAELENMQSTYKKYTDYMSGKVVRTISTIAGGTAVTALTGGLALAYAPAIAAMIAGEAVVGLHGAALASASLAFVGGGSLAAGGLGMAGGTAIITGGGALLGLAGSGSASAVVALMATSDEYWMRQGAKLLTHCKCTLVETLNQKLLAASMLKQVEIAEKHIVNEIAELKQEDNDLDKEYLKHLDSYLGCLKKVRTELQKLTK